MTKIAAHITKKVADKLNSMFTTEREKYEKLWDDIKTFVKYASIRDRKFYDRVAKGSILYEKSDGTYVTLDEYLDGAKETNENKVYYTTDKASQSAYISMFAAQGIDVVVLPNMLDTQFAQDTSRATARASNSFAWTTEVASALSDEDSEEIESVAKLFRDLGGEKLNVEFKKLKDTATPAVLNVSEESRRMEDMMKMYAMSAGEAMPDALLDSTLIGVNTSCPIITKLSVDADEAHAKRIAKQVYTLAKLSQRKHERRMN